MKLKTGITALVLCSAIALTACASKRKMQEDGAVDDANTNYSENDDAQTSGLGEEGDKYGSGGNQLAKRTYYFDFDSNTVHDDDRPAIEANAERLASNPSSKAILEGHTDPRGSREYNIGLGERRAKAVANIMTSKGANRSQIRIVSYGAEKLAAQGHSESAYQQDRRAVLVNSR